jgi:hypothetical protein
LYYTVSMKIADRHRTLLLLHGALEDGRYTLKGILVLLHGVLEDG